jgi:hypothetical protein
MAIMKVFIALVETESTDVQRVFSGLELADIDPEACLEAISRFSL